MMGAEVALATVIRKPRQFVTLRPGDIILTGAPGSVEQLSPGDVVEIEIPGIGTLSNPVVAEEV